MEYQQYVSPGFTPRPSLSDLVAEVVDVALVQVSPGFTPRPSLSALAALVDGPPEFVSPGFTPRPSLSVAGGVRRARGLHGRCRRGSRPGLR